MIVLVRIYPRKNLFVKYVCFPYCFTFFTFMKPFFLQRKSTQNSLCTHYKVYLYTIIQGYSSFHPSTPDVRCHLSLPAPPGRLRWWRGRQTGGGTTRRLTLRSVLFRRSSSPLPTSHLIIILLFYILCF